MEMDSYEAIYKWAGGKLSARPEYYSGRGPQRGDLGPEHLGMLHAGIKRDVSEEAAAAFVELVKSLTDLSATNFLNQFHYFAGCGYMFSKPLSECGMDVGPDGPAREVVALFTIGSMLGRAGSAEQDRETSEGIKAEFLQRIGEGPAVGLSRGPRSWPCGDSRWYR